MIKRMWPYMRPYKKYLFISCFCVITETIFELVIPIIMADIIDVGVANGDKEYILVKGMQMIPHHPRVTHHRAAVAQCQEYEKEKMAQFHPSLSVK